MTDSSYIGRFAPSPSGPLHFGSLVAAVGSYLDARAHKGRWLIRIEDIDTPRVRPGADRDILSTLEQFGFQWDGEPLWQSGHRERHLAALEILRSRDLLYPCRCSRREIAGHGAMGIDGMRYPGICRHRQAPLDATASCALRVKTDNREIIFTDRVLGVQRQQVERAVGDFIVRRADGIIAYQLAVVVDDAAQGINQVVRGADLLTSTPRQILLQRLLGLPTPRYCHLPLVTDGSGRKLSKQDGDRPVDSASPLPALIAAYGFLGQQWPDLPPDTIEAFWSLATANWDSGKIPRN